MKRYRIIKKIPNVSGEFILLYPSVQDDLIYEFDTMEQAQEKINQIKNMDIYKNIVLDIKEIDY